MRSVGPAVAGFLILWLGPGGNFLIQAALFGGIALNTLRISFPAEEPSTAKRSFTRNLKDGIGFVLAERTTRTFLIMGLVLPLFIIPVFAALTPVYAKTVFGGGPEALGLLVGATGAGSIAGGLVAASFGRLDRRGLVQVAAVLMLTVSLTGLALSPSLPFAMLFIGLGGFFEMIFITGNQTLLQLSIPDDLRGRVTSLTALSGGLMPVGAIFAGAGSDLIGAPTVTILMAGSAGLIALAILALSPTVRDYSISRAVEFGAGRPGSAPSK
jgi:hypothetical protein